VRRCRLSRSGALRGHPTRCLAFRWSHGVRAYATEHIRHDR
jgi:hypothetical protein